MSEPMHITVEIDKARTEQLRDSLADARDMAVKCEVRGQYIHTWTTLANTIQAELDRREAATR